MPLSAWDVVSAVGAPVVLGVVVVGVLRGGSGASPVVEWASALVGGHSGSSRGGIGASHWLTLLGAGLLLAVIRGAWMQAAVAWQSLLLASWCDADAGRGQTHAEELAGRRLQRQRQLLWQGRAVMAVRLLNLNIMGCWLYSYAISEINSRRSVVELGSPGGFTPTPNSLPPCLHTMNAATIVVWLGLWLCKMGTQGKVNWNRRQLVHLRVQSTVQCAEKAPAAAAVASSAAEWRRGAASSRTNNAAEAVLLPESAGPCGLKTPLLPIVVAGGGVVFGRKPPPLAAQGGRHPLGQLRECALACHAGWCAVDAPRVSTVHCALFRRSTGAASGEKGFVLYDFSASGVYLNGSSLSAAPPVDSTEGEREAAAVGAVGAVGRNGQQMPQGRAVGFGDRITLMVCASPHAEICYQLLPASAASWEWVSHAVEAERVAAADPTPPTAAASLSHHIVPHAATAVGERQKLVEKISVLEQQQLLLGAERGMILPSLAFIAMLLCIALWNVGRTLDCPVDEYVHGIVHSIQRSTARAAARGVDKKPSAVEARRLVQPASILFFWWLLYSSVMATALIGGWCFLRSAERRCESSLQEAEEQLADMLASNRSSSRVNVDAANQAAVSTEVAADEDEEEVQVQVERQALCQFDDVLAADANDGKNTRSVRDHLQLAVALSAALRACGADEAAAASDYTAPHELRLEELRCPVSLTLMNAAVSVLPCGHVFDRSSLVSYIASANKTVPALPARCPFGCDSSTMIVVPNDHVRKAVADARSSDGPSGDENQSEGAAEQSEYGDDEAVAAIFGSAAALTAYQALLADSALPVVFDCKGAKPRQLDALLLHLERVGWYNPLQHPLADGASAKSTTDKLQTMLRMVQPLSSDLANGGRRWLLQPARTLVLLTQILRRLLDSPGPGLSVAGRTQAHIVVVRLLSKVAEIIAGQNSPELLLQLIRAAKTIDVVVELFGAKATEVRLNFRVCHDRDGPSDRWCVCARTRRRMPTG